VTAFRFVTAFFRGGAVRIRERFAFFVSAELGEDVRYTLAGGNAARPSARGQRDAGQCGGASTRSRASAIGLQARPEAAKARLTVDSR
jgi:hypothetical protein